MTNTTDNTAAVVRNEAQRLFDGFTVDVLHQVVFNQKVWNEITEGHPGRLGRELLVKSKDLPEPVNTSTREAIIYTARYFLGGKDMQVSACEYSRRYIDVIRSMTGIDLSYLGLKKGEDPKFGECKINAILHFMTYILNAARDRTDINWSYLESEIPPAVEGTVGDIRSFGGIWKSGITIPEKYGLTEFWSRLETMKEAKTDRKLWKAMQEEYKASHSAGSRFEGFEKIRRELLPKGYAQQKEFTAKGKTDEGPVMPLADICDQGRTHLAVIGEGGIGKTTFLQQYLKDTYFDEDDRDKEYKDGVQVPVFIELSRCTEKILDWNRQGHTTFVARYLGKLIENHDSLEDVSEETIEEVEKLLQRRCRGENRTVLLLLDGFNEVTTDYDNQIRQVLSDEIRYLMGCSNVRIIITSRETGAAGFLPYFEKVRLVGLEPEDIRDYLEGAEISSVRMDEVFANPTLMECLRIPLFLWMFTSRGKDAGFLPENAGEIMYLFFHKDSPIFHTFYSERQRQSETGKLDKRTLVVLDYILPFVAHRMYPTFMNVSASILGKYINDAAFCIRGLFLGHDLIPNEDFEYSGVLLQSAFDDLYVDDELDIDGIINCIHGSLGIMYRFTDRKAGLASADQYAFIHHHVRDYFAAIWQVKLLEMIGEVIKTPEQFLNASEDGWLYPNYQGSLNESYWKRDMKILIGQVLMEHRNRSVFDEDLGSWVIPEEEYEEQYVLNRVVRFCSLLRDADVNTDVLLDNVIGTILLERGEVAGMDLSGLDLRKICLFNECCSKKGLYENSYLAADFSNSWISEETFTSSKHKDDITDIMYRQARCFTYDGHTLKCHDLETGKVIITVQINRREIDVADEITGKRESPFMLYASNNGKWCCYAHNNCDPKQQGCIELIEVDSGNTKKLFPSVRSDIVTTLSFTEDSQHIIAVFDDHMYCVFDLTLGKCCRESDIYLDGRHWKDRRLYCQKIGDPVYACETREEDEATSASVVLLTHDMMQETKLFRFSSIKERSALIVFSPEQKAFIFHDDKKSLLQVYDIELGQIRTVFRSVSNVGELPQTLHLYHERPAECLLLYEYECYQVPFGRQAKVGKYETFHVKEAKTLSGNRDLSTQLAFRRFSAYCSHYVLVADEVNNYEWDLFSNHIQLKYGTEQTDIENMIPDRIHRNIILLHSDLGITVFHELDFDKTIPLKLDGFYMKAHDYSASTGQLAVLFVKPGQAVVEIVTIASGQSEIVLSEHIPEETNFEEMDVCYDSGGRRLLIQLPHALYEYRTDRKDLHELRFDLFREDDMFLHAGYDHDLLNVITGYQTVKAPYAVIWCSQFRREKDPEKGYCYTYYRSYLLPQQEEWLERFIQDRQKTAVRIDGILKDEMEDFDLGQGYDEEDLLLSEWMNHHDVVIRQGILIPHGTDDINLFLTGFDDMQKARERWDRDKEYFNAVLMLDDIQELEEQEKKYKENASWPVRYYKDRLYCFAWNPDLYHRSYHDIGFSYYDTKTGACILMTGIETLELKYLKQIRNDDLEHLFEKPVINPNEPEPGWPIYKVDWTADDVQPWTEDYNIYYFRRGKFGRVSRFPENWDYKARQIYYSPGVCVKNCSFIGAVYEGETKAVLRRSGAIV